MDTAIQAGCIFVMIWFTPLNIGKMFYKEHIPPWNFVIMAAAWTGFIWITWL